MTPVDGFDGPRWKWNRDSWAEGVRALRRQAITDIESRRAIVPSELAASWEDLVPVLDEVEQRDFPRDHDLWCRVCRAIKRSHDLTDGADEMALSRALLSALTPAVLFCHQTQRDEDDRLFLRQGR